MIKLSKQLGFKDFETMYWLTSVKGKKDDLRHHINTIHIDSGVAVKTDGGQLYCGCLDGSFPDGDYEIIKRTKGEIIINRVETDNPWPKWEEAISLCPVPNNGIDFPFSLSPSHDTPGTTIAIFYMELCKCQTDDKPVVNSDFVSTALGGFDQALIWFTDSKHPVFFTDHAINRVAAIMPLRTDRY